MRGLSAIFWPPHKASQFGRINAAEGQEVFSRALLASLFCGGFARFAFDFNQHAGSVAPWIVCPATAALIVGWGRWYYRTVGASLPGRVLVVEDDPATANLLERNLRRRGWDVDGAATIRGAIDLLSRDPRAVLLDLTLADGSGMEVFRHMRLQAHPARLVILTGSCDRAILAEITAMRPTAVFSKPLDDADRLIDALGDPFEA